jgi:hypothetical protein
MSRIVLLICFGLADAVTWKTDATDATDKGSQDRNEILMPQQSRQANSGSMRLAQEDASTGVFAMSCELNSTDIASARHSTCHPLSPQN